MRVGRVPRLQWTRLPTILSTAFTWAQTGTFSWRWFQAWRTQGTEFVAWIRKSVTVSITTRATPWNWENTATPTAAWIASVNTSFSSADVCLTSSPCQVRTQCKYYNIIYTTSLRIILVMLYSAIHIGSIYVAQQSQAMTVGQYTCIEINPRALSPLRLVNCINDHQTPLETHVANYSKLSRAI